MRPSPPLEAPCQIFLLVRTPLGVATHVRLVGEGGGASEKQDATSTDLRLALPARNAGARHATAFGLFALGARLLVRRRLTLIGLWQQRAHHRSGISAARGRVNGLEVPVGLPSKWEVRSLRGQQLRRRQRLCSWTRKGIEGGEGKRGRRARSLRRRRCTSKVSIVGRMNGHGIGRRPPPPSSSVGRGCGGAVVQVDDRRGAHGR